MFRARLELGWIYGQLLDTSKWCGDNASICSRLQCLHGPLGTEAIWKVLTKSVIEVWPVRSAFPALWIFPSGYLKPPRMRIISHWFIALGPDAIYFKGKQQRQTLLRAGMKDHLPCTGNHFDLNMQRSCGAQPLLICQFISQMSIAFCSQEARIVTVLPGKRIQAI